MLISVGHPASRSIQVRTFGLPPPPPPPVSDWSYRLIEHGVEILDRPPPPVPDLTIVSVDTNAVTLAP